MRFRTPPVARISRSTKASPSFRDNGAAGSLRITKAWPAFVWTRMYFAKRSSRSAMRGLFCFTRSNLRDDMRYLLVAAIRVDLDKTLIGIDVRKDFASQKPG